MRASAHPQALRASGALGPSSRVVEFDDSTHTAQEAPTPSAASCADRQVHHLPQSERQGGAVIASGVNKVDEKKVAPAGEKIERASPDCSTAALDPHLPLACCVDDKSRAATLLRLCSASRARDFFSQPCLSAQSLITRRPAAGMPDA